MRRVGFLTRFLQRIQTASIPWGNQLISLFRFFPSLCASNFFFEVAHSLNHRGLLRLGRERAGLGGENSALKINDFTLDISHGLKVKKTLSEVSRSLEAENRALDARYINYAFSPRITLLGVSRLSNMTRNPRCGAHRKKLSLYIQKYSATAAFSL